MTDTAMQKQFDNETVEAEKANNKPSRISKLFTASVGITGIITVAIGAYYAYGILFPDPWYVRALAIFGF